jgi:hypothetical protein
MLRTVTGARAPGMGAWGPVLGMGVAVLALGCTESEETHTMKPLVLGMTSNMGSVYSSDEMTIYEAKLPVQLRITQPTTQEQQNLNSQTVEPYGPAPWVTIGEVKVQVSWTLSNLDPDPHNVEILLDPWNEYGRYWPGLALVDAEDEEFLPNLSGIDILMELPGTNSGDASRRFGTFTYQDMDEVAIDLATVMNILKFGPQPDPANPDEDPTVTLANHAFAVENRSFNDPLVAPFVPQVIAGLVGFDIGLRTYEPANLALELVVEILDKDSGKVLARDDDADPLPIPTQYITVGYGGG